MSALLALFVSQCAFAQNTVTVDGVKYALSDSLQAQVCGYDKTQPPIELVIPQSITVGDSTYSVTSIGDKAFQSFTEMTSVFIPEGVTSIGTQAFSYCVGLESVSFPEGLKTIGVEAFYKCQSILCIVLPESLDSIGDCAFLRCNMMRVISYSQLEIVPGSEETGNLADFAYAVYCRCVKADDFVFPNGDRTVVCGYCGTGSEVSVPEGVKKVADCAFFDCGFLTSVSLPESITSIGDYAFYGCPLRNCWMISNPVTCGTDAFSQAVYIHSMLYVPSGMFYEYAYDESNDWFRFCNIREYVSSPEQVSPRQAYMLMNSNAAEYTVYDSVNGRISTIAANSGADESNACNCWMMVSANGRNYLYNLGADKFAYVDGGEMKLTDKATSVSAGRGNRAISLEGMDEELFFIENSNVAVKSGLDDKITGVMDRIAQSATVIGQYGPDGRESAAHNGISIIRYSDGTVRKYLQ